MPKKVVIRINNARPIEKIAESNPREIIVYHWRRIFAALAIGSVLLGGAIWAGWPALRTRHETAAVDPGEVADGKATPAVRPTGPPKHSADKSVATESPAVVPPATQVRPDTRSAANKHAAKTSEAAEPRGRPVTVTILSKNITRAQLTSRVADEEPVDALGAVVPMNDKGLIRVYLFTETSGLKGKTLFHDWYWSGKRMAHARIPVRRNDHKAASSKFIDRIMTGPWEVRVVDDKERVLARAAFEVR